MWWAAATLLITTVGVVVSVGVLVQAKNAPPDLLDGLGSSVSYLIPYGVVGAFLVSRRPDLPFGWLLAATAAAVAIGVSWAGPSYLAASHGDRSAIVELGIPMDTTAFLPVAVQGLVNVRFPSGRVSSRWGRTLELAIVIGIVLGLFSGFFGDQAVKVVSGSASTEVRNRLTAGTAVGSIASDLSVAVPLVILLGLIAGLGVVRRAWKATGIERDQLRWRAFGVVLSLCLFPLAINEVLPSLVDLLDGLLFAATIAIPVLRYRLWAIDTIIRRSVVYALTIVVLVAAFVGVAAIGTTLVSDRVGFIAAAAVIGVAFAPVLLRSQRLVDHYFYGDRNDPYRAISDLGRRLERVVAPAEVLPAVVTAIADSLRLPYVAIEGPADGSLLAVHGQSAAAASLGAERWALMYQGETVGWLVASPRRGEAAFDSRDRVVLADIARQAGAAVRAEALTAHLLDSRKRLINAREEERRRLRRDLHDGLGPLLTAIGLNVDAARSYLTTPTGRSEAADPDTFLARAKESSAQAIADLRGIVYGLRPPALDDLGLAGAIRMHIKRLTDGTERDIRVEIDDLPELPAAIEVAAYRVTVEAVNNVVRHAQARNCSVRLSLDAHRQLHVDVCDDGPTGPPWSPGVGLHAMRERVAEVNATMIAGPAEGGGRVQVWFPLPAANPPVSSP